MAARAKHVTVGAVAQAVSLTNDFEAYEIVNVDGAGRVYVRNDGVDPTVEGDECDVLPAAAGASILVPDPGDAGPDSFRLISDVAAVKVAVIGRNG